MTDGQPSRQIETRAFMRLPLLHCGGFLAGQMNVLLVSKTVFDCGVATIVVLHGTRTLTFPLALLVPVVQTVGGPGGTL
jgi:hypothetical protein